MKAPEGKKFTLKYNTAFEPLQGGSGEKVAEKLTRVRHPGEEENT